MEGSVVSMTVLYISDNNLLLTLPDKEISAVGSPGMCQQRVRLSDSIFISFLPFALVFG